MSASEHQSARVQKLHVLLTLLTAQSCGPLAVNFRSARRLMDALAEEALGGKVDRSRLGISLAFDQVCAMLHDLLFPNHQDPPPAAAAQEPEQEHDQGTRFGQLAVEGPIR